MNNDLIHRSAALAVLEELKNHVASPDPVGEVADAIETMRKVQAVDAEPVRHGEWVISESPAHLSTIKCSECGTMYQRHWKAYCNFCPECGTKMDARREEVNEQQHMGSRGHGNEAGQ